MTNREAIASKNTFPTPGSEMINHLITNLKSFNVNYALLRNVQIICLVSFHIQLPGLNIVQFACAVHSFTYLGMKGRILSYLALYIPTVDDFQLFSGPELDTAECIVTGDYWHLTPYL